MNRRFVCLLFVSASVLLFPFRSPAPLIYTPGEGWTYEAVGSEGGAWRRATAKEQLIVAQDSFDKKDFATALRAAHRVVKTWPLSDFAPQAQYLVGRCYQQKGSSERSFNEYQKLLEKYPKVVNYDEVLNRQYEIADRFLGGEWFRLWGYIPYPSMEKTAALYEKIVKNGPYSDVAPQAQLKIGQARERQSNYPEAVKAYERAADRYNDRTKIVSDALYHEGLAYYKQAATAEYDQNTAAQAIAVFEDFIRDQQLDPRVPEAQKIIAALRIEQARGSFETAKFYEKSRKWASAKIYYNEVVNLLLNEPNSTLAVQSRERLDALNQRLQQSASSKPASN